MTTAAAAWFAAAFFLLPGFLLAFVSGLKAPGAVAAALPVSFGLFGASAWMWGLTSAPFNLWTFGVSYILALIAAGVWRTMFVRKARRGGRVPWRRALYPGKAREYSVLDPYWVLPAVGVAAGAWTIISDRLGWLARVPNGTYNIVQGWDVQWHANLVRFIMDTGVASATRMGELQNVETHADMLYPSAYHAGVALFAELTGLEPIPAINIASTVLPGIAFPLSVACLVFAFMRSAGLTAQIAAGLAAVLVYAAPQILWVPEYVGMWPYLFAVALTGMVIWQFITVPQRRSSAFAAALGFLGVLNVHPSAVSVVVIAVVLFWLTRTLVTPERSRVMDTVWMATPAAAAALLFLPQVFAGSEQAGEVASWAPKDKLGVDGAWGTAFLGETRHVADFFPGYDPTAWLWLAGAGALVLLVWRGQVWPLLFYFVHLVITVNALKPFDNVWGDLLSVVGNLHYNTGHRLIMPVAMSVIAAAAIAVAAGIRLIMAAPVAQRYKRGVKVSAAGSVILALVAGGTAVGQVRDVSAEGAQAAFEDSRTTDRMVNADDLAAFDWLATRPEAYDGLTMGDPADGHSWLYAYTGVPTVSRHYQWPTGGRGSATDTLQMHADLLGHADVVDQAAEDLGVRFFILSPGPFWPWQTPRYEMLRGLWTSDAVTPVYRKGDTAIFAVNSAFSRAELKNMRKDALEHGSDELFELKKLEEVAQPQAPLYSY